MAKNKRKLACLRGGGIGIIGKLGAGSVFSSLGERVISGIIENVYICAGSCAEKYIYCRKEL